MWPIKFVDGPKPDKIRVEKDNIVKKSMKKIAPHVSLMKIGRGKRVFNVPR